MTPIPPTHTKQGVYGIVGRDIQYTLSPLIFRQVFDSLKWPAVYAVFDQPANRLKAFVAAAADAGIVGFNVTQPYKIKIMDHLDRLDRTASVVGAVNTVACRGRERIGYNTDVDGVEFALRPYRKKLQNASVVIIGSGGAARAVGFALADRFGVNEITFAVRNTRRAAALVRALRDHCPTTALHSQNISIYDQRASFADVSLIVNATPVGMGELRSSVPIPARAVLSSLTIVFDLIYSPRQTRLLQRAERAGCRTVGGWPMLVAQAESAFRIWTGDEFPPKVNRFLLKWNPRP